MESDYPEKIERMIQVIRDYGLSNENVFAAMRKLPRHFFIQPEYQGDSYGDYPVPTMLGQTISQPYTVAIMLDALNLEHGQKVLEIGTGSGWHAGLIKLMVGKGQVTSIEYQKELVNFAKSNLKKVNIRVRVIFGDGISGCPKKAPYDRITITAACKRIPDLIDQLTPDGILLVPVGNYVQTLLRFHRKTGITDDLGQFRFVPCLGKGEMSPGWEG